ncbi:MAG: hypothetical protein GX267_11260 [Fibrobacter sp.]|jgi:hypothetical protein|nr:hypothetical protein [Fibrobacter sp.]
MTDAPIRSVAVMPQQKKHYESLLPQISAITEYTPPPMPVEEAVGEANRVIALIKEDRARLELSGIKLHYLDSFEARAGAFIWSAVEMSTHIKKQSTARDEWEELKPKAKKVRRYLLKVLKRAFREDKDLSDALKRIIKGRSRHDWLMDFLSISRLAQENKEKLQEVHADLSLIEHSAELYTKLSDILARMVIEPDEIRSTKVAYYKAWTYLREALKEVYEAGQYVFDEDDKRHSLYYSEYHVRLGKAAARARRNKKALEKDQKKSKKEQNAVDNQINPVKTMISLPEHPETGTLRPLNTTG